MWDPLKHLYGKRHIVDHSNVPYGVISDHDSDSTYVPTDEEEFFLLFVVYHNVTRSSYL